MNKKILGTILVISFFVPIMAFGAPSLSEVITRVTKEIDTRIVNLNKAITRINEAKRLTVAEKQVVVAPLKDVVDQLTALRQKVSEDKDMATATADFKSVTQSYRVYALVMPRSAITLAGQRIRHITASLKLVKEKINARLAKIPQGTDVLAITQLLSDFDVKVADAEAKVESAMAQIATLNPDNGDQGVLQSNINTLGDARDRIKSAHQAIKDARRDLGDALKLIQELEKK